MCSPPLLFLSNFKNSFKRIRRTFFSNGTTNTLQNTMYSISGLVYTVLYSIILIILYPAIVARRRLIEIVCDCRFVSHNSQGRMSLCTNDETTSTNILILLLPFPYRRLAPQNGLLTLSSNSEWLSDYRLVRYLKDHETYKTYEYITFLVRT